MPDGIESEITQGGTNVSGGQRQRLAIARALVVRPDIYVFDDALSALDLATEARPRSALARPPTVVIVAQRASSIRHADQILVLAAWSSAPERTTNCWRHVTPTPRSSPSTPPMAA